MSIAHNAASFSNNLRAEFTDKQISSNVTYTYVQDFKDVIGFRPLLEKHLAQYGCLKAPILVNEINCQITELYHMKMS